MALLVCLALPPATRATAFAATAGILFEAAPFVLAAALVPPGRAARALALLGCGCGRRGPGALGFPAFGICLLAFGPLVAFARAVAALALALGRRSRGHALQLEGADPLHELARIAPSAFAGALLAEALRGGVVLGAGPPAVRLALEVVAGAALGIVLPCATGAVAIAAGLRAAAPGVALGLLVTAGIVAIATPRPVGVAMPTAAPAGGSARVGLAVLALACATLALHGPSGFVNPRFLVPLGAAAAGAALLAARPHLAPTRARAPWAVPALLILALAFGSPVPDRPTLQTILDEPVAGEAVRFVGALAAPEARRTAPSSLVRYVITCCRADAQARSVRLDRTLPGPPGTWYTVDGRLALDRTGAFVLRVGTQRPIQPPRDPFEYR